MIVKWKDCGMLHSTLNMREKKEVIQSEKETDEKMEAL